MKNSQNTPSINTGGNERKEKKKVGTHKRSSVKCKVTTIAGLARKWEREEDLGQLEKESEHARRLGSLVGCGFASVGITRGLLCNKYHHRRSRVANLADSSR